MMSSDCLLSLLFISILRGVSCEELSPAKNEESSLEDSTVTLSYKYSKQATGIDYFFWYRQYPGKPPEFIISHLGTGGMIKTQNPELKIKVDQNQINMSISSAAVTDSAVYYCAVKNAQSGNRIYFSSGTKLTVEPDEDYQPSYYKLSNGDTSACLAAGFSRNKAAQSKYPMFNETDAVRISGDSLYNQVSLLSSDQDKEQCGQAEAVSGLCEGTLEQDETVNAVSLAILGLRLIFIKTVVFNVLMTLRLWISH